MKEITETGAKFMDGTEERFDSIILATGYKSNVPSWLKVNSNAPLAVPFHCLFLSSEF
jgi:indole-3-pyruvate monooxygenase